MAVSNEQAEYEMVGAMLTIFLIAISPLIITAMGICYPIWWKRNKSGKTNKPFIEEFSLFEGLRDFIEVFWVNEIKGGAEKVFKSQEEEIEELMEKIQKAKIELEQQNRQREYAKKSYEQAKKLHQKQTEKTGEEYHAEKLGLKNGYNSVEIKKTYRKMVMKFHPDRNQHRAEKYRCYADKRIKEINEAYAFFKNKYNFS